MKYFTKKLILPLLIVVTYFSVSAQEEKSISMGALYAQEVYYSFENGVVLTSSRNTWDIAFYTPAFSAGIITNDGNGVELYQYPNASNEGWDSFDTTGKATWTRLFNDVSDYENGAFNRLQKGHPDYGWGVYNINSHDVVGDSLFLIKTADGKYRKLNIVRKRSTLNEYEIRYADLDGQNEQTVTLNAGNYQTKLFMSFSFENGLIDREPDKNTWDMVFTRYLASVQNTPYPVIGVLLNPADTAAEARGVADDFDNWASLDYTTGHDVIGHDWKTFNMGTMSYDMEDSLYFFVKAQNGNIYKINFTSFSGSSTGNVTFNQQLVSTLSLPETTSRHNSIYPNPAKDNITVVTPAGKEGEITISNLTGKQLNRLSFTGGLSQSFNLSGLENGVYIVTVVTAGESYSRKIVILND